MVSTEQALEIATKYHEGEFRKYSGDPYIVHPTRVGNRFYNKHKKIAGYSHDLIENTELTLKDLELFGYHKSEIIAIDLLTRRPNQDYLDYILLVKSNKIARAVKIEDIKDNMSDLHDGCKKSKYAIALYILQN